MHSPEESSNRLRFGEDQRIGYPGAREWPATLFEGMECEEHFERYNLILGNPSLESKEQWRIYYERGIIQAKHASGEIPISELENVTPAELHINIIRDFKNAIQILKTLTPLDEIEWETWLAKAWEQILEQLHIQGSIAEVDAEFKEAIKDVPGVHLYQARTIFFARYQTFAETLAFINTTLQHFPEAVELLKKKLLLINAYVERELSQRTNQEVTARGFPDEATEEAWLEENRRKLIDRLEVEVNKEVFAEKLATIDALIRIDPEEQQKYFYDKLHIYEAAKDHAGLLAYSAKLLSQKESSRSLKLDCLILRAEVYNEQRKFGRALKEIDKALAYENITSIDKVDSLKLRAQAYYGLGMLDKALEAAQSASRDERWGVRAAKLLEQIQTKLALTQQNPRQAEPTFYSVFCNTMSRYLCCQRRNSNEAPSRGAL